LLLSGKLGVRYDRITDETALALYRRLQPEASDHRWFVPFALGLSHARPVAQQTTLGVMAEIAGHPPDPEYLYVAIERPMGKPHWSGNPELRSPLRATLRTELTAPALAVDLYGSHVSDYVQAAPASAGQQPFMTYENVDAWVAGADLRASWRFLELYGTYQWGEERTHGSPLAEIPPPRIELTLSAPRFRGLDASLRFTYSAEQQRVDRRLEEEPTADWSRLDLGTGWRWQGLVFDVDVENVTGELISQHLSYMRNPYAAGVRVYEPGRVFRLGVSLDTSRRH
jgi:iron complex outermembrane receptor protein